MDFYSGLVLKLLGEYLNEDIIKGNDSGIIISMNEILNGESNITGTTCHSTLLKKFVVDK